MTLREELIEAGTEAIVSATGEDHPTALKEAEAALDALLDVLEAKALAPTKDTDGRWLYELSIIDAVALLRGKT